MRKYFNLILNIPPLLLTGLLLYKNWSILSIVLALCCVAVMIKSTATSDKSPVQIFPVYLFGTFMSLICVWLPSLIANRNATFLSLPQVTERITANINTELTPLIVAVVLGVLLSVVTAAMGKKTLKDIGKIITTNAFCIAVVIILYSGTYLEKLSIWVCVVSVLYALLFSEKNRLTNGKLSTFIVFFNLIGIALYIFCSDYVEFSSASKLPAIIASISGKTGRIWAFGILAYFIISHAAATRKSSDRANDAAVMLSTITLILSLTVYCFIKTYYPVKYFIWTAPAILLVLNILYRSLRSGRLLQDSDYIYTNICAALIITLTAIFLGKKDTILNIFGSEIIFYISMALLLGSVIFVHIRKEISFALLTFSVLLASIGYCTNISNIILISAVGIAGFLLIFAQYGRNFYPAAIMLVFALFSGYINAPSAKVFVYRDAQNVCGDTTLGNSLLCILAEDKYTDTESLNISWDDGESRDITGFKKAFTRVRSGKLTVTSKNTKGAERKQVYSFAPTGEWQPPTGRYIPIENGYDALKIVEFDKASMSEKDLPIKRGRIIDDGNVYVTDKNVCISMASRTNARAIEYVIVDAENNVLSDGYVANTSYIEIAFPTIPEGSRLLAIAMDGSYNTIPVTSWNIIG